MLESDESKLSAMREVSFEILHYLSLMPEERYHVKIPAILRNKPKKRPHS